MTTTDKNTLKQWFSKGAKPLAAQFAAWIDAFWHKDEMIPASRIEGLQKAFDLKADSGALAAIEQTAAQQLHEHNYDEEAHGGIGYQKLDKDQGVGNAGKVLGIDSSGMVIPVTHSGGGDVYIESDDWYPSPVDPNGIGGSPIFFNVENQCHYHIIGNRLFFSADFSVSTVQLNLEIIDFEVYGLPEVPMHREIFQVIAFPKFGLGKIVFMPLIGIADSGILHITAPHDINGSTITISGSFEFDPNGMKSNKI